MFFSWISNNNFVIDYILFAVSLLKMVASEKIIQIYLFRIVTI